MCYLKGTISLLLLLQKFLYLSLLQNHIKMTKTSKLFMYLVLQKKAVDDYYVFHKFLMKKSLICIPKCSLKYLFLRQTYGGALMGHLRINKVYKMLHKHFCWPKMKHDIHKFCSKSFKRKETKSRSQPNRWCKACCWLIL